MVENELDTTRRRLKESQKCLRVKIVSAMCARACAYVCVLCAYMCLLCVHVCVMSTYVLNCVYVSTNEYINKLIIHKIIVQTLIAYAIWTYYSNHNILPIYNIIFSSV